MELEDICKILYDTKQTIDAFAVEKNTKWGVVDEKGQTIILAKFDYIFPYYLKDNEVLYMVLLDNKYGVCDKDGKFKIEPLEYDRILPAWSDNNTLYFHVSCNEKRGICDKFGKNIIPPLYDNVSIPGNSKHFEPFYTVELNGKEGVCDLAGKEIIVPKYESINRGKGDPYYMIKLNKKFGICDLNGKELIYPKYDQVRYRKDEELFEVENKGKTGVCNIFGKEIIPPKFDYVTFEKEGNYYEVELNKKYGVFDLNGKEIISPKYDYISFEKEEGFYEVKLNNKYGICDLNGVEVIPTKFDYISIDMENECFTVTEKGKEGIYSLDGGEVLASEYDNCYKYNENNKIFYIARKEDFKGLLDQNKIEKIPFIYNNIYYLNTSKSLIFVGKDKEHEVVYNADYNKILSADIEKVAYWCILGFDLFTVKSKEGCSLVDLNGKVLIPSGIYTEIVPMEEKGYKYILVEQNNRFGICNLQGTLIVPCQNEYLVYNHSLSKFVTKSEIEQLNRQAELEKQQKSAKYEETIKYLFILQQLFINQQQSFQYSPTLHSTNSRVNSGITSRTCPYCKGTGYNPAIERAPFYNYSTEMYDFNCTVPGCNEKSHHYHKACPECRGTGKSE